MSSVEIARNGRALQFLTEKKAEITFYANGGDFMVSIVEPGGKDQEAEVGRAFLDCDTLEVVLMEALEFVRAKNPKLP